MQSVSKLAQQRWTGHVTRMLDERLSKRFSMENCKKESAHKVAKRNATKTPLKPRLGISIFKLSPWNGLHRIEQRQSGVASLTREPHTLNQRGSANLKESVKKVKKKPRDHHQPRHCPNCNRLFKLKLAYTAINEHTIAHEHLIFRILEGLSPYLETNNHSHN